MLGAALGILMGLGAASSAEALGEPLQSLRFVPDAGVMTARYRRLLGIQEGERLSLADLKEAERRFSKVSTLEHLELKLEGNRLDVLMTERPAASILPVPLPVIWEVGLISGLEQWRMGPCYGSAHGTVAYIWDSMRVEGPRRTDPVRTLVSNYSYGSADLSAMLWPDVTAVLQFEAYGADIQGDLSRSYDPAAPAKGWSLTLGPELRFDQVDDNLFPRAGIRTRAGVFWGAPFLGNVSDFARYQGEAQGYFPLGDGAALVTGVKGGMGRGVLPWHEKLQAGGIEALRGYAGRRFMGDQLLVGTIEARRKLLTELDVWGLFKLGLTGGLFLDAGRVWDTRLDVPFPQDVRAGVGAFLGMSLGNLNASRLEVGFGNEGPAVGLTMGLPFDW